MDGEPVIPAPLDDDDDDVAWALQTAAIQWQRGQRADAVVWLRRAVDAAISAGNPARTQDLTRLAASVADRLIAQALAAPDSVAPAPRSAPPSDGSDVDDLLATKSNLPPPPNRPRASAPSLTSQIPVDFDDSEDEEPTEDDLDDDDDDLPTIPPAARHFDSVADSEDEEHDVTRDELFSGPPSDEEAVVSGAELFSAPPVRLSEGAAIVTPQDIFSAPPVRISETEAPVAADELFSYRPPESSLDSDEPFGAVVSPTLPSAARSLSPAEPEQIHNGVSVEPLEGTLLVAGISLDQVRGFEDLPESAQFELARRAVLTVLSADEEVGSFGAALVTSGRVGIMPSIADVAASIAAQGEIVFTRGTLEESVPLRVVALEDGTTVASWSTEDIAASMADCPWVADELRLVADRLQALAGAVLGPLGERLDDQLRELVMSRLDVKAFNPGETIVTAGKIVPGLHVVGAGRVEIVNGEGHSEEVSPGEFLFAAEVLSAGKARASARAGKAGALVLFAPRSVAHELMMSVPPLLEILAG